MQSCVKQDWVEHEEAQTVNTAWAVIALMRSDWKRDVIDKGIQVNDMCNLDIYMLDLGWNPLLFL